MADGKNEFGRLLRDARAAKGLTQEDVARRIDASHRSYARWENGNNTPQGSNLWQLVDVLELDAAAAVAAASSGAVAPGVRADQAHATATELAAEVARLTARVAELEAAAPTDEHLRAVVDAIVAARLAGITPAEPSEQPEPAPRAGDVPAA